MKTEKKIQITSCLCSPGKGEQTGDTASSSIIWRHSIIRLGPRDAGEGPMRGVQCKPCKDCYEQHDPLFDPEGWSSTYAAVSCGARECREFCSRNCSSSFDKYCRYEVSYGDQSRTVGSLARDTPALTPTAAVPGFMFGCDHRDAGVFGEVDGLVGLGRGKASLISQVVARYEAGFSYCLPSSPSTVGYLTFGGAASAPENAQFTAMVTGQQDASFYYLNLTGVKVAGRAVKAPPAAFASAAMMFEL